MQTKTRWTTFIGLSFLLEMSIASQVWAADDNSTLGVVSDMLGVTSNKSMEKIDYSERPKLVMPPKRDALPPPRDRQKPEGWPVDADSGARRTDRFARHPNASPEKPKPTLLEHINGPHRKPAETPVTEATSDSGILGSIMNLRDNRARLNEDEAPVPSRNLLSEPPDGFRTPTQDLSKLKDPDKKDSFWNFLGHPVEVVGDQKTTLPSNNRSADTGKPAAEKNSSLAPPANAEKAGFFSRVSDMISGK